MRRWIVAAILAVSLALGWTALGVAAPAAEDKVKEATARAAKDYLQHGLVLAGEGQDEAAAESFRKAIALAPQWAEAHSLLGSSLTRSGKLQEAEEELRKAVQLKPDYSEGWYYLGQFLKDRGKEKEAEEAFGKARQYSR